MYDTCTCMEDAVGSRATEGGMSNEKISSTIKTIYFFPKITGINTRYSKNVSSMFVALRNKNCDVEKFSNERKRRITKEK